jgi:putative DNA methylase
MAVAGTVEGERGRVYLPADAVAMPSESVLRKRLLAFGEDWPGPAALAMPEKDSLNFKLPLYGIRTFAQMFTDRQAIALLTLSRSIRSAHGHIAKEVRDSELAKAVLTYLALALDKLADNNCSFSTWEATDQIVKSTRLRNKHSR